MPLDDHKAGETRQFKVVGTRPLRPDGIDKVTGRARFGADMSAPGMLIGRVLRSPHAHARIRSIDTSKAEALSGVKAVVTRADFGPGDEDVADILDNCMAGEKALYDGHAVAAVAATSAAVARKALKLIEVDYETLPHVTDVDAAMKPDAPVLHEGLSDETVPEGVSQNVVHRVEFGHGDVDAGFAKADKVLERSFKTAATHQGYIEPHACLATMGADGIADLWVCTQGHYMVRNTCAAILGIDQGKLRVTASEIGGGFGGKTTVFLEPVALALSRKANRPVKMTMTREEVLRATGPTSSTSIDVKIGMNKDGKITAASADLRYQGGAYPGSPADMGSMTAFAPYDLENVKTVGWDVVTNRPKAAAYRAPGAPMAAFAVESVVDELAKGFGLDDLNALRDAVRQDIENNYAQMARTRQKRELLDKLAEGHDFALPPGMVDTEFDAIWKQFEERRERDELDEDEKGKPDEELKEEYRNIAERRVRLGLVLSEIGNRNEIQVGQDDLSRAIIAEAQRYPGQEREVMEYFQKNQSARESLRAPLYEDKVIDFILELVQAEEKVVTLDELMAVPEDGEGEAEAKPKKGGKSGAKSAKSAKTAKSETGKAATKDKAAGKAEDKG